MASPGMAGEPALAPDVGIADGAATATWRAASRARARRTQSQPATGTAGVSLAARVTGGHARIHAAPGGPVVAEVGPTTEFGSPTALAVVEQQGSWLGVVSPELGNGTVGWVDAEDAGVELAEIAVSASIDLSRRVLVVRRGEEVLRRIEVGVGAPGSPTPTGRFAVTDKLPGERYSASYGCCIIALSARQPNLPAGWTGGDRIAIHGTPDPSTIGAASSAGCPHASEDDLRYLMRELPLGTQVVIHP